MDDIKKLQAVRKLASELESKVEQKQAKAQQSTMQAIDLVVSAFKKFKEDVKAQMEVVRSIPPEKGDKGEKGDPGLPGANGKDGRDGKDGKDGQDGQDGVSVVDARLDFDGHLVMVLSNGTEIDAGVLAPEKASEIYATLKQTIDGGGGSALTISDEGVTLTSGATKINFVGATVTASATGDEVTVNVSAGTGSVTSVGLSVPTGLSVSGSPITTSGTIAISLQSGYSIPTTASQTNWDAAYGWGNHASAGYLTTESDPTVPSHVKAISTTNISNWNDAYTDRLKWDGGATGLNATTGRTSLGLGTISTQAANNVSITGGSITGITDLAVADGGTGASTASGARTNLLPSYSGNAGKVLAVNTGATDVEWVTAGSGSGTVTSVNVSGGTTGLTTSGGPITSSGTITLAGTLAIANGGTGQTTASGAINALLPSQTGNSGKYLTTNGSVASWATVSGGGGGISSADIQEFTSTGTSTWTKPAGAKMVHIVAFGGGGGGGSGRKRGSAAMTLAAFGGAGGGAGGRTELWIEASLLAATETVTVGAGGTGAAAQSTDDTSGITGNDAQDSSFGSWIVARQGKGGAGGGTGTTSGGASGGGVGEVFQSGSVYTAAGGNGNSAIGNPGVMGGYRPGGGGGGSGFAASSANNRDGAEGGLGGAFKSTSNANTGGGGSAGVYSGARDGGNGANASVYYLGGSGGGSGANGSYLTNSNPAGSGGDGGYPGGGGGGGGAGYGVTSGAGGDGANGYVRVTTYF